MKQEHNKGFVLVTSLVFLIVLSLLGVMAMRGSLFDERMAANDRDRALAREYAEMALRDAERDILGIRFDGVTFCRNASGAVACGAGVPAGAVRPEGTRPTSAADAGNFWVAANPQVNDAVFDDGGLLTGDLASQGMYSAQAAAACGKPVWSGANWEDNANPARSCAGTINSPVPTVPYGRFTDAPFVGPDGEAPQRIPRPRYLIEMFKAEDLGIASSNKLFFRITAVGFGQTNGPTGRTSVTLQSVFSPL